MGERNRPVGSRNCPEVARKASVGTRNCREGARKASVVARSRPVGARNCLVGARNLLVGQCNEREINDLRQIAIHLTSESITDCQNGPQGRIPMSVEAVCEICPAGRDRLTQRRQRVGDVLLPRGGLVGREFVLLGLDCGGTQAVDARGVVNLADPIDLVSPYSVRIWT